mgnify:FL=1
MKDGYRIYRGYRDTEDMREECDVLYDPAEEVGVIRNPLLTSMLFREWCFFLPVDALGWPYILHVQRLVVSDPGIEHPAGIWHRDMFYQNFTTSRPIAITTLLAIDPVTENAPLYVIPNSHKREKMPSERNKKLLRLAAGDLLVFDSALFHCNGVNRTETRRRSLVTIFSHPMLKQHTDIAGQVKTESEIEKVIFGLTTRPHDTDEKYRESKQ